MTFWDYLDKHTTDIIPTIIIIGLLVFLAVVTKYIYK